MPRDKENSAQPDLVRRPMRASNASGFDKRRMAMLALVGIREDGYEPEVTLRELRRGIRIDRLEQE